MTAIEKNIACAEECGICTHPDGLKNWWVYPQVEYHTGGRCRKCGTDSQIPDFSTDWNTRPLMWSAMTEDQRYNFMCYGKLNNRASLFKDDCIRLIAMDQPTFRDTFLKVKGRL